VGSKVLRYGIRSASGVAIGFKRRRDRRVEMWVWRIGGTDGGGSIQAELGFFLGRVDQGVLNWTRRAERANCGEN
jgi:hypothetical protein